jgi:hypothetical protein
MKTNIKLMHQEAGAVKSFLLVAIHSVIGCSALIILSEFGWPGCQHPFSVNMSGEQEHPF